MRDSKGQLFAGSQSCFKCHTTICDSFAHTAHEITSRTANDNSIKGSFREGQNKFVFGNAVVVMEKEKDSFYQVEYDQSFKNFSVQYDRTHFGRFDIVIGSNTKGQSYLSWNQNQLYELPISYFTLTNSWCNSPGNPFSPVYNRVVTSRCLECHTTYAKVISKPGIAPEQFDSKQIIYGITCERCHGAAAKHVAYQSQHPDDTMARYIVNPAKLSRRQDLDLCSLCHSGGQLHKKEPSFSFTVGDVATDAFVKDTSPVNVSDIDVHGNQYGLLSSSLCFKKSETMTCVTCHNTHHYERGNTILFSQRCLSCHNNKEEPDCSLTKKFGSSVIHNNCIDCHMPLVNSKVISITLPGDTASIAAKVRSHFISIYPSESEKIMAVLKKRKTL